MDKQSYKVDRNINPLIKKGDKVKLIDGSGLSHINSKHTYYIVLSYPSITGTNEKLKDVIAEVVETNIDNYACQGAFDLYLQDVVIQLGNTKFRTPSEFLQIL